jgi:hypothetical protein
MTDEKWHGGPIVREFGDEYFLRDDTEIRSGCMDDGSPDPNAPADPEGYSLFRREPYGRVMVFGGPLAWALDQISQVIKDDKQELEKEGIVKTPK